MTTPTAAPFLKWAGGKRTLAPTVVERAPRGFGRYHEPFLGGGAVFFAMAAARPGLSASLNDANAELIGCYEVVRDAVEPLIERLGQLAACYLPLDGEGRLDRYVQVRANEPADPIERAARLIFLNRTGYNGLYRVNSRGQFNVPHGRYRRPRILDADGLRAASAVLQRVDLSCDDFEAACLRAQAGDFVYLDPPYQPLSATAHFTAYTPGSFGRADQLRLRDAFDAMTARGVAALLSNSEHPAIVELYEGRGYTFERVPMSRSINSRGSGRAPIPELLISNFDRVRTI